MRLLDHILLGQDFETSSEHTLKTAIALAKEFKSKITPIYVLPNDIENVKVKQLLEDTANSKLTDTVKVINDNGIESEKPVLKYGSVSNAITVAAMELDANLLVIGAGNATKDKNFKLGTTTERIIQKSEKPVFVVKENVPLEIKQILCPVDFSIESKRALNNAILISRKYKAQLTILSVSEIGKSSWLISKEMLELENSSRHEKHKAKFNEFLKDFSLDGLNWEKEVPKGNPSQEILNVITVKNIDLLVIGTTGRTGLNRLLIGSVTEKVIREVPCNFLTLKSEDAFSLQLDTNIKDIEQAYEMGVKLMADSFYDEAIKHFKNCLNFNSMHVPAYFELAKAYDKINKPEIANGYREQGRQLKEKLWYSKIEDEVRKLRGS